MTAIKVDRDIPVPDVRRRSSYPFVDLEPGHSFAVPCTFEDQAATVERVRSAAAHFRKKTRLRFVVRPLVEGDKPVVRCWRAKDDAE